MIPLSECSLTVLRRLVPDSGSKTRTQLIQWLHNRGIFAATPDGLLDYHSKETSFSAEKGLSEKKRFSAEKGLPEKKRFSAEKRFLVENRSVASLPRLTHDTDARFDVLIADRIHVTHNLYFQNNADIRSELLDNRRTLSEIHSETQQFHAYMANISATDMNRLDVPVSNKLGTSYELVIHPIGQVSFEQPFFKCVRVDEIVHVFIEFLVTNLQANVDILEIPLPYAMRAAYVPFQSILRNGQEFTGMPRSYGRNGRLYIESHLLHDSPQFYVNVEGTYLTRFDQPFKNVPIRWITPVRYGNRTEAAVSHDMVTVNPVLGSDLGFNRGKVFITRSLNRVDMMMEIYFSQRTRVNIPEIRFEVDLSVLNERVFGPVNGYGACYLPEHGMYTVRPPRVRVTDQHRVQVRAFIGFVLFHDVLIHAHMSFFSSNNAEQVRQFEKPIVRANSTLNMSNISIHDLVLYDAYFQGEYRLYNRYNVVLRSRRETSDYHTYRHVPLEVTMTFKLQNQTVTVSNIHLFNQLDQNDKRYLYPRRKLFHIKLYAYNYREDYEGPFTLTPDFTENLS